MNEAKINTTFVACCVANKTEKQRRRKNKNKNIRFFVFFNKPLFTL